MRRAHVVGLVALLLALGGCASRPVLAPGEELVAPDEDAIAAEMVSLIRDITLARSRAEGGPVRRFNQVKTLACLDGTLQVPALPAELAQGVFAEPASFPVTVRLANASEMDDREADLRGFSMVVRGLPGGAEQHFLFNSHPALFAADPEEFLGFIRATADDSRAWWFLNPFDSHLGALMILLRARDTPGSVLDIPYWSTTPSRFGPDAATAVKHAVLPCSAHRAPEEPGDSPDYLRERIGEHLAAGPACFDFAVQFQTDPARMPVEDASVVWPESLSPMRTVARITLAAQPWLTGAGLQACEAMSFNPWTGLDAHRPLGGINRVRDRVYREIAEFRRRANQP